MKRRAASTVSSRSSSSSAGGGEAGRDRFAGLAQLLALGRGALLAPGLLGGEPLVLGRLVARQATRLVFLAAAARAAIVASGLGHRGRAPSVRGTHPCTQRCWRTPDSTISCSPSTVIWRTHAGPRAALCGGRLHTARYARKPRGRPCRLGPEHDQRFSFCCAVDGCRSRATPPSLRFLGRRVYVAAIVVLIAILRHGVSDERLERLAQVVSVDRRTIARWRRWWRDAFTATPFWRIARAGFMPPIEEARLPATLIDRFDGDGAGSAGRPAALPRPRHRRRPHARFLTVRGRPAEDARRRLPTACLRSIAPIERSTGMAEETRGRRVHERWAHLRFSVIGQLLAAPPGKGELKAAIEALSARTWRHPTTGEPVRFGFSTIERWYYRALRERSDPVGVLRRKMRADAGQQAAVSDAVRRAVLAQYAAHKSWSIKLHHDNLVALAETRPDLQPMPSYPTLLRFMRANGLDKRRRLTPRRTEGAERAEARLVEREVRRYEAEYVNGLWHWDCHHGSRKVLTARGEWATPPCLPA